MDQLATLLTLPTDLLTYIFTFLKFNTCLPITCKLLYYIPFKIQCWTGTHLVPLVQTTRRLPARCLCTSDTCRGCQCPIMPMCVPTRCSYGLNSYVCDECRSLVGSFYNSYAFGLNIYGQYCIHSTCY